jgi:hypothetical protein
MWDPWTRNPTLCFGLAVPDGVGEGESKGPSDTVGVELGVGSAVAEADEVGVIGDTTPNETDGPPSEAPKSIATAATPPTISTTPVIARAATTLRRDSIAAPLSARQNAV